MSDYTESMTVEEMREEIAEMLQCGEGFIATEEKLLEYVDDFIAKVRADAIEEIKKYAYRNIHFYDAIEQVDYYKFLDQLNENDKERIGVNRYEL